MSQLMLDREVVLRRVLRSHMRLELSKQQAPGSPQTRIALASAYAKVGRNEDAAHERAEFLKLKQLSKKPGEQ